MTIPNFFLCSLMQVISTVEEIQERHDAVKEIEKRLSELHQVYILSVSIIQDFQMYDMFLLSWSDLP